MSEVETKKLMDTLKKLKIWENYGFPTVIDDRMFYINYICLGPMVLPENQGETNGKTSKKEEDSKKIIH